VLLLDEPFAAVDRVTRQKLYRELAELRRVLAMPIVLVTHDLDEAVTLSDRVIVLSRPPSRVLLDEPITMPHPRDVFAVRQTEAFSRHFHNIWSVLGEEFRSTSSDGEP
jgi:NitT/TauT family transport system ATP-binding protein